MLYDNTRETASQPVIDPNEIQPQSIENQGEFHQSQELQGGLETSDQVKLAPDLPSEVVQETPDEISTDDIVAEENHEQILAEKSEKVLALEHLLADESSLSAPGGGVDSTASEKMQEDALDLPQ